MVSEKIAAGRRDTALDGWRGLAILGVLFDHFVTRQVLNLGRFGVEMFFVLSGMLMADILFVKRAAVVPFFARRFARIYPAMAFFATALFLVSLALPAVEVPGPAYVSALTMTANYVSVFWRRTYDFDHLWSLCVEQHTYLCLGLIAAVSRWLDVSPIRLMAWVVAVAILDGAICRWGLGWSYNATYWRSDVRGGSILIGAIAFLLLRATPLRGAWVPVVAFAAGLLLNLTIIPDPLKYSVGTIAVAISACTLGQAPAWCKAVVEHRWIVFVGVVSYSVYLWQEPFSEVDDTHLKLVLLPLGLACGIASFYLVEQPARRALNRLYAAPPQLVRFRS